MKPTIKMILQDRRGLLVEPYQAFEVKKLVNTTKYKIGDYLDPETVDMLIQSGWQVTITQ